MSTYDPEQTGNYYLLGDSHAEMTHLLESNRYFTRAMGGLLPEQPDEVLLRLHDVLDIGCGPGGWVLELAQAFPDVQVTGLDISRGMIDYATVLARASKLDNAHFRVGNAIEPLAFADHSFDLVNARQLQGAIPAAVWPTLLREMVRITRPGGILRISDNEWGVTNSPAFEAYQNVTIPASVTFGLSHAPDARNTGLIYMMSRYLRDAGCVHVQGRPSFLDFSAGAEQQQDGYRTLMKGTELIEPFLLKAGVITQQEFAQLKRRISMELVEDTFRGIFYIMTTWGQKPEA